LTTLSTPYITYTTGMPQLKIPSTKFHKSPSSARRDTRGRVDGRT